MQHFLTVFKQNEVFALQFHPGKDESGWGSTLFAQPFFKPGTLGYTESVQMQAVPGQGVSLEARGKVSRGEGTEGDWDFNVTFTFYRGLKKVEGRGSYNVYLDTDITTVTGDLSLYKVSSNVMNEVKGHNGQLQNTGSMETCNAQFGKYTNLTWDPRELTSFSPDEFSSDLTIACTGAFCDDERIRAGYKPSLSVELNANSEDIPMTFDGSFSPWMDKDYFRDNIAVSPLVRAPCSIRRQTYDITIISDAPGDGAAVPDYMPAGEDEAFLPPTEDGASASPVDVDHMS